MEKPSGLSSILKFLFVHMGVYPQGEAIERGAKQA